MCDVLDICVTVCVDAVDIGLTACVDAIGVETVAVEATLYVGVECDDAADVSADRTSMVPTVWIFKKLG